MFLFILRLSIYRSDVQYFNISIKKWKSKVVRWFFWESIKIQSSVVCKINRENDVQNIQTNWKETVFRICLAREIVKCGLADGCGGRAWTLIKACLCLQIRNLVHKKISDTRAERAEASGNVVARMEYLNSTSVPETDQITFYSVDIKKWRREKQHIEFAFM